ncbi:hypothetical protein [Dyella japonica]|uniref:Uncharacterized protein n=1 Tax=Dyella japonica TaxID=231455 RepID=A0ABV2JRL6_9GAMM
MSLVVIGTLMFFDTGRQGGAAHSNLRLNLRFVTFSRIKLSTL